MKKYVKNNINIINFYVTDTNYPQQFSILYQYKKLNEIVSLLMMENNMIYNLEEYDVLFDNYSCKIILYVEYDCYNETKELKLKFKSNDNRQISINLSINVTPIGLNILPQKTDLQDVSFGRHQESEDYEIFYFNHWFLHFSLGYNDYYSNGHQINTTFKIDIAYTINK